MSRSFATLLILFVLLTMAVSPQRQFSAAGFLAGSLLVIGVIASIRKPAPSGGMPLGLQLGLLLLLSAIATLYSPYFMRSWEKFSLLTCGFLMFYFAWHTVRDIDLLQKMQWAMAAIAVLVSFYSLGQQWSTPTDALAKEVMRTTASNPGMAEDLLYTLNTGRMRGPFGNPNHLAGFLVACSTPLMLWALRGQPLKKRLLGLIALLPVLAVIILTQSRSGLLTLVLSFIILAMGAFSEFRKNIFHWKISPLKVVAVVLVLILLAFVFGESWVVLSRVGTIKTRLEYDRIAMHLIASAPLFGHGLDSFALFYPQFHQLGRGEAQYVHNWPLEIWLDLGLVGLAVFIWWIFSIFKEFNHSLNAAQNREEESALLVLMSSVSAILLQSLFDFNNNVFCIFVYLCFFLGCLAGRSAARVEQQDARQSFWSRPLFRGLAIALLIAYWVCGLLLPYYAESQHDLGVALVRSGEEPVQVIRPLELATVLNPFNSEYRNSLGNHYLSMNQPKRAAEDLQAAVDLSPLKPRNHFDLYKALWTLGERQQAMQELRQAHQLHPTSDEYLIQLALRSAEMGNEAQSQQWWYQAAGVLTSAIENNPEKADYHRRLAAVLDALGKPEEAAKHREQAHKIMNGLLASLNLPPLP